MVPTVNPFRALTWTTTVAISKFCQFCGKPNHPNICSIVSLSLPSSSSSSSPTFVFQNMLLLLLLPSAFSSSSSSHTPILCLTPSETRVQRQTHRHKHREQTEGVFLTGVPQSSGLKIHRRREQGGIKTRRWRRERDAEAESICRCVHACLHPGCGYKRKGGRGRERERGGRERERVTGSLVSLPPCHQYSCSQGRRAEGSNRRQENSCAV